MKRFIVFNVFIILAFLITMSQPLRDMNSEVFSMTNTFSPTETTTPIPARDLDLLPTFDRIASADYENCILPCWWGFRPGKTTIEDVLKFIEENDLDRRWESPPYTFTLEQHLRFSEPLLFDFRDTYYDIGGDFLISWQFANDLLELMHIDFNRPDEWLAAKANRVGFPQVLSQMEDVPEIYISPNPTLSDYAIIVVFRQQKVQIGYTFDLTRDHLPRRPVERLCLNIERTKYITMRLNYLDSSMSGESSTPLLSIPPEEAYGISTAEFVQFFRDHPDECLEISQYKEQQ